MDPVEPIGVVTITKSEYDRLTTQSGKYLAYVALLTANNWVKRIIEENDCRFAGCNAVSINETPRGLRNDLKYMLNARFVNCKWMQPCYGCKKIFCDKHEWNVIYKDRVRAHFVGSKSVFETYEEVHKCCNDCLQDLTLNQGFLLRYTKV